MTNYQMPVLTDAQREQEIGKCIEAIARITKSLPNWQKSTYTLPYLESELLRQKIALAALMSTPFMYAIADCDGQAHFDEHCVSANPGELADEIDGLNDFREEADFVDSLLYHEVPVYTAPPVPALKLPGISSLIDNSEGLPSVRDVAIWDAAIAEVKRLNGVEK